MLRTLLAAASAVLICGSGPALATPFTVEDLAKRVRAVLDETPVR